MSDNSLLLLAVKRSMAMGPGALKGGNSFSYLYGISSLFQAEVEIQNMPGFIDFMVEECTSQLPATLAGYRDEIVYSLREAADYEEYLWAEEVKNVVCNSFYENSIGKFHLYNYLFANNIQKQLIDCESLTVDLEFKLADICIALTRIKKRLFGRKKKTTEYRYIKPAVKFEDFVNALAIVIAPLIEPSAGVKGPSDLSNILRETAIEAPDTMPSDAVRRTVYDPMKKMNVVVTDPEVLKLMPGKWEKVTLKYRSPVAAPNNWEFDN